MDTLIRRYILIADDAELNRNILAEIFQEHFEILEAVDGEQAVFLLEKYQKDIGLLLLDLIMPHMDGFDVLSYMRKKDLIETLPVLVITGDTTDESTHRAFELGAADVIHKPFSRDIVFRRGLNIIEQYESRLTFRPWMEGR
ncbi:MAG: response regulator [Eubacteriales bacterium]|nr:response regulator [Eubacteriales bacterium]